MRAFVCLLILAAAARADTSVTAPATSARRNRPVGYIVSEARGHEFLSGVKRYWTPTQEQVDRLEDHLVVHLKDTGGRAQTLWKELDRYGRQYVGFVDAKGRKKIWVKLLALGGPRTEKNIDRPEFFGFDIPDRQITWDAASDAFSNFICYPGGGG